jgi:GH24 family phage-related lysozyme (muramidase)
MKKLILPLLALLLSSCASESFRVFGSPSVPQNAKAMQYYPIKKDASRKVVIEGIKHFEGFYPKPYTCPGGRRTIGYGFTGNEFKKSMTRAQADAWLENFVYPKYSEMVKRNVSVPLKPNQFNTLVSFTFNAGEGNLKKLINGPNRLNSGNYNSVAYLLPIYSKCRGRTLPGLYKRRMWEAGIWNGNLNQEYGN